MKHKSLRKWRLPLILSAIAIIVITGIAWAAGNYVYPNAVTGAQPLSPQAIPGWVRANVFSNNFTSTSIYPNPDDGLSGNHVTINGTVDGLAGGAAVPDGNEDADVFSNTVTMTSGTIGVAVVGAATATGNALNNTVTIRGGTIGRGTTDAPGLVIGGFISGNAVNDTTGHAAGNTVEISGGTINDHVFGGYIQGPDSGSLNSYATTSGSGNAIRNTVTINGGTLGHQIFGGRANTGDANENKIFINGGAFTASGAKNNNIIAGSSESGNALSNDVTVTKGISISTGSTITGGEGAYASGNRVTINVPSSETVTVDRIQGGASTESARENKIVISGGKLQSNTNQALSIYGANNRNATGTTENNSVTISGNAALTAANGEIALYGGAGTNSIIINIGNIVSISGTPKFTASTVNVYGGGISNLITTTDWINNTVSISGRPDFGTAAVNLYGGDSGDSFGNTLKVATDSTLKVRSVQAFNEYEFAIPSGFATTAPVLQTDTVVYLDENDMIHVSNFAEDTYTLISNAFLTGTTGLFATRPNGMGIEVEPDDVLPASPLKVKIVPGGATLTVNPITFPWARAGYAASSIAGINATVNGSGAWANGSIQSVSLLDGSNFTPSGTAIAPIAGLSAGTYTDTVVVRLTNGAEARAAVSFTVVSAGSQPPTALTPTIISGDRAGSIVSVDIATSEGHAILTFKDGTTQDRNLSIEQLHIEYPPDKFTATAARGNMLSATGQGTLIPETAEVSVVPTVKDVSGLTPGITLYPLPATIIVNSGATTITADLSSLRPGTYSLKLESVEGANPFFSALLFDSFEVPGNGSSGGGDESLTPGWSSDAGGCDAGFAGLALLVAGSLLAIRKGSKR